MKKVFITGATGFLGTALVKRLASDKEVQIVALVRPTSNTVILDNLGVEKNVGDIKNFGSFYESVIGCDTVYHLAGVVTDWAQKKVYEDVHVKGTKNILEAAYRARVKKVIHISTIDVIATKKQIPHQDDDPYSFSSLPYIRTKILAEKLCCEYLQERKLPICIVRPAWIYGPGDKTLLPEIAYQVKKDKMVYIASCNNYIPLVYIDNLVEALLHITTKEESVGHTFIIADQELITWKELVSQVIDAIGGKKGEIVIPYSIAYIVAFILELVAKILRKKHRPLLTRTSVELMGKSIILDVTKIKKMFGYQQKISLQNGLESTLHWLKEYDIDQIRVK